MKDGVRMIQILLMKQSSRCSWSHCKARQAMLLRLAGVVPCIEMLDDTLSSHLQAVPLVGPALGGIGRAAAVLPCAHSPSATRCTLMQGFNDVEWFWASSSLAMIAAQARCCRLASDACLGAAAASALLFHSAI